MKATHRLGYSLLAILAPPIWFFLEQTLAGPLTHVTIIGAVFFVTFWMVALDAYNEICLDLEKSKKK